MSTGPEQDVDRMHQEAIRALMGGDSGAGRRLLSNALARGTEQLGNRHPSVLGVQHTLAGINLEAGRFAEAEAAYRSILAVQEQAGSASGPAEMTLLDLAKLCLKQDRVDEAESLATQALALVEASGETSDVVLARVNRMLSRVYERQGRSAEAAQMIGRSQAAVGRFMSPMFASFEGAVREVALETAELSPEECRELEPHLRRSLALSEQLVGPEHSSLAVHLEQLASLLRKMEREGEATELEDRARRIRDRSP